MRTFVSKNIARVALLGAALGVSAAATAAPVYLNDAAGVTVTLGAAHAGDPEPFANRTTAASLASIIDAPTATSGELHTQSTHVWVSGGPLELVFDFGAEYDLSTLHFWNYHSENYDVDTIVFTFYDDAWALVGELTESPVLGNLTGSDSTPITPEDYALAFPTNVRYVNAYLTGSNNQVDFNNIGFTAVLSDPDPDPVDVPEPATLALLGLGLAGLGLARRRRGA
ncbi:PEP-CTERM sorting domain-containing protein [Sphingosinicella soli]|uniref:Ice-binding protein C-terminal domain-containing protein n=1 Tax=Sphingosinicella soli TaxID=333708 RepID=A0A7W7F4P9_9SPHN|nr:hypothetical protein [Sphingosinicella soli]